MLVVEPSTLCMLSKHSATVWATVGIEAPHWLNSTFFSKPWTEWRQHQVTAELDFWVVTLASTCSYGGLGGLHEGENISRRTHAHTHTHRIGTREAVQSELYSSLNFFLLLFEINESFSTHPTSCLPPSASSVNLSSSGSVLRAGKRMEGALWNKAEKSQTGWSLS